MLPPAGTSGWDPDTITTDDYDVVLLIDNISNNGANVALRIVNDNVPDEHVAQLLEGIASDLRNGVPEAQRAARNN